MSLNRFNVSITLPFAEFVKYPVSISLLPSLVEDYTLEDDLILTMGAGNINKLWDELQTSKDSNLINTKILAA